MSIRDVADSKQIEKYIKRCSSINQAVNLVEGSPISMVYCKIVLVTTS